MQFRVTIERLDDAGEYVDTILTLPVSAEQVAEIVPDLLTSALGVEVSAPESGSPSSVEAKAERARRPRRTKAQIAADAAAAKRISEAATAPTDAQPPAVTPANQLPSFDAAPKDAPEPAATGGAAPFNPFAQGQ